MSLAEFDNALRILHCIDHPEVADFISDDVQGFQARSQWLQFREDPVAYFMRADDATKNKLWEIIKKRQPLPEAFKVMDLIETYTTLPEKELDTLQRMIDERRELLHMVEVIRDADEDCHRDDCPTMPRSVRLQIDALIEKAGGNPLRQPAAPKEGCQNPT